MSQWDFKPVDPSAVRIGVTQRDQFNNDDVGLADALVREVIQNSTDAGQKVPVKVRFALRTLDSSEAKWLAALMEPVRDHLTACGIDTTPLEAAEIRVLAIEDFNTSGLTGSFEDIPGGNFDNFWRAMGESEKSGKSGGRWGLGKLVYSSSSRLRTFFGLTLRQGDTGPALMGQAVLKSHRIGNDFFPAHGFWFDDYRGYLGLQYPVTDAAEVAAFSHIGGLTRTTQTGLSLIIPYLADGIDESALVSGVVSNYYFPILAGQLVVEVGTTVISRQTFLEIAGASKAASQIPFGFVRELSDQMNDIPEIEATRAIGVEELADSFFPAEEIARMKEQFARGGLVHARVPVQLKPKTGPDEISFIDLYLQSIADEEKPFTLFARGLITLPGERRNFSGAALGAMIAVDERVAAFLGDAENPAHTAWNPKAEKLTPNWRRAPDTLATIRHALRQLYSLVAEQAERQDDDALLDFFSILEKAPKGGGKRPTRKPVIDLPPREKAISIRSRRGGFDVVSGPAAAKWTYPREIRVRMAYDMIGANPFARHSRFDFDLEKENLITIEAENASFEPVKANILKVVASSPEFRLSVRGFDEKRDIVVDARAQ